MKDEHVKDAAQGVAEDVPQDAAQDLSFGARAAHALPAMPPPPPPPPSLCSSRSDAGATGQLSGIWLGLWASASGGAAQSASMLINWFRGPYGRVGTHISAGATPTAEIRCRKLQRAMKSEAGEEAVTWAFALGKE